MSLCPARYLLHTFDIQLLPLPPSLFIPISICADFIAIFHISFEWFSLSFLVSAIPFLSSFYIFFFFGLLYPVSFIHLYLRLCFFLPFLTNPKPFILVSRSRLTVWLSNWISLSFKLQLQFQSTKRGQGNEGKLTLLHPSTFFGWSFHWLLLF